MRRFIVCAATILIAQCAAEPGVDRRMFVAKAIRRSPTHNDLDSGILPMARRLRPKTNKPTPPPTTTEAPTTTVAPTRAPQQPPPQPNYPPPSPWYRQQQGTGAYMPQGYQYPPNYPYYAQSRPQQQPPQFFNPFMPYYQGQGGQPVMIPVPVPVPMAAMPDLPGIPNLMQPFGAPSTTPKPRKSHKRHHHYATLMPQEEMDQTRSPTQEELDTMDRNEVRRAPVRRRQQTAYYDEDYSEEETTTAVTMFPTLPTMAPMKLPTLPPFTMPPSFEKLLGGLGITTPKPKKEKRRKEKRRREYEEEEEYVPVKRRRMEEASESRPHGRSLAVEDDRGRNDPFEDMTGFEEQKEEKEEKDSVPSVADRLMMKSLSSKKKKEETGGEEDWLVPFRK